MIFKSTKKSAKKSFLSFDKFITGIIIGWAAASIFWLSKSSKGRGMLQSISDVSQKILRTWVKFFWCVSIGFLNIFTKNK